MKLCDIKSIHYSLYLLNRFSVPEQQLNRIQDRMEYKWKNISVNEEEEKKVRKKHVKDKYINKDYSADVDDDKPPSISI